MFLDYGVDASEGQATLLMTDTEVRLVEVIYFFCGILYFLMF